MQQAETPLEMGNRFQIGELRSGMPPRLQPLIDGAFGVAGGGQVMREQLRLALDKSAKYSSSAAATRACNS